MREKAIIGNWPEQPSACRPIRLTHVNAAGFLGDRVSKNNGGSIPAGFNSPLPRGFEQVVRGKPVDKECRRPGPDSDLFKWLEGAAYALASDPGSDTLRAQVEHVAGLLLQAQEKDGPIATYIRPSRRFDTTFQHDLYIAGHFFEAAVAHQQATGKSALVEAACRWADFFWNAYREGHPYFQTVGESEHPEIELALVRLYRATGEQRYLDFAAAIADMSRVGPTVGELWCGGARRHAVRVGYLLAARVELYLETGNDKYLEHIPRLWEELNDTRFYVTGGVAFRPIEIIPDKPYELPQSGCVAETCASIAMMLLGWRLHAVDADSRHFDRIETILYNHFLGAISQDQMGIFYFNPIRVISGFVYDSDAGKSLSERTRLPDLHPTTCCFPNAMRFLAQLPEYLFSWDEKGVFINLYTDSTARHTLADGAAVTLAVETAYPHDGHVRVRVLLDGPRRFRLRLRIPSWSGDAALSVNGGSMPRPVPGGYCEIDREWQSGDTVELELAMPVEIVESHPAVSECAGQIVFRRGPLVYCLERCDSGETPLERIRAATGSGGVSVVDVEWRQELLGGMHVLWVPCAAAAPWEDGTGCCRAAGPLLPVGKKMMVPFYARGNRGGDRGWLTWMPA